MMGSCDILPRLDSPPSGADVAGDGHHQGDMVNRFMHLLLFEGKWQVGPNL